MFGLNQRRFGRRNKTNCSRGEKSLFLCLEGIDREVNLIVEGMAESLLLIKIMNLVISCISIIRERLKQPAWLQGEYTTTIYFVRKGSVATEMWNGKRLTYG